MILCPFCHFHNEDGALFCEQCKSDLSGVPEVPEAIPEPVAAEPFDDPPYAAMPVEAEPVEAEPVYDFRHEDPPAAIPALPVEDSVPPVEAMPIEALPADPITPEPVSSPPPFPEPPPAWQPPPAAAQEAPPAPMSAMPISPAAQPLGGAPPAPPPPLHETGTGGDGVRVPTGAEPQLVVLRGQKRNAKYPIYEGLNFIGRADEKPVDIDLEDQEPPDRIWCSRQHALISFEEGSLYLEDLNSANGTFLNRTRVYPGQKQPLKANDVIQIGNVQLKLVVVV